MMEQAGKSHKELEVMQKFIPFALSETSYRGWKACKRFVFVRLPPCGELSLHSVSLHAIALTLRPPQQYNLRFEGLNLDRPLPTGSILVVPAGNPVLGRWQGSRDMVAIYLEPSIAVRVATESFGLDPTRTVVRPVAGLNAPDLRSAILAVDAELRAGGAGGPLLVESLATVLSVHLIRHFTGSRGELASADGVLPRRKLRTVIESIMENLEGSPTLAEMAALVHLSPYHFARQFKEATGLPHQYIIARRIERAQHLLQRDDEVGLANNFGGADLSGAVHRANR